MKKIFTICILSLAVASAVSKAKAQEDQDDDHRNVQVVQQDRDEDRDDHDRRDWGPHRDDDDDHEHGGGWYPPPPPPYYPPPYYPGPYYPPAPPSYPFARFVFERVEPYGCPDCQVRANPYATNYCQDMRPYARYCSPQNIGLRVACRQPNTYSTDYVYVCSPQ